MKGIAVRQYVAAAFMGLILLGQQVFQIADRFGNEGLHARTDLMQQFATELLEEHGFAAKITLFVLFAIGSHLLLTVGGMWVYRRACSQLLPKRRDAFWRSLLFVTVVVLLAMFANRWLYPQSASFVDAELLMIQWLSPLLVGGCIPWWRSLYCPRCIPCCAAAATCSPPDPWLPWLSASGPGDGMAAFGRAWMRTGRM